MIRRLLASQGRQATAAHAAAAAAAEAAGTLASPLLAVGRRRGIHTWYSISTSGVTRGEDQLSWDVVEAAAAERIARHTRPGKGRLVLAGNDRLARKQRSSVIYEGVPRPKSQSLSGIRRPEKVHFCDRIVTDDFWPASDCRRVVAACETAIQSDSFLTLPERGEASFTPLQPVCEDLVGSFAYRLLLGALEKMRLEVQNDYHTPELHFAGALLSRLSKPPGLEVAEGEELKGGDNASYFNPHIDKANKRAYDFSAILYLNSQAQQGGGASTATSSSSSTGLNGGGNGTKTAPTGANGQEDDGTPTFSGGDFTFLDADANRTVSPLAGRMLSFTSGFENPHQVQPVASGKRYALSVWLTTDPQNAYSVS